MWFTKKLLLLKRESCGNWDEVNARHSTTRTDLICLEEMNFLNTPSLHDARRTTQSSHSSLCLGSNRTFPADPLFASRAAPVRVGIVHIFFLGPSRFVVFIISRRRHAHIAIHLLKMTFGAHWFWPR